MKKALLLFLCIAASQVLAQAPNRPLRPLLAYTLEEYRAIDFRAAFDMPAGMEFASVADLAINSANHLIALQRGPLPFLEFDAAGKFIRAFGDGSLFDRTHGLAIDKDDNLWVTDVNAHFVMKLDPDGNVLMTLGTPGESGVWNEASGSRHFLEPNNIAFDSVGNVYVAQGHGYSSGTPGVLKFTPDGEFISQWGKLGHGRNEMVLAHAIAIDSNDLVYVADRENLRIQIFDTEGKHLDQWSFNTLVCALYLHDDGFLYMTTGFDGELAKLDLNGEILGAIGRPGSANGEFGEAHGLVVDADGNVFVSDVLNRRVQKFQRD
tara:strand:+ start:21994 stop:22956 length:963 start_codon:yes stop_codon:yes gene_type:complete